MFNKGCGMYTLDVMQVQLFFFTLNTLEKASHISLTWPSHIGHHARNARSVCGVYPIWGHKRYIDREG